MKHQLPESSARIAKEHLLKYSHLSSLAFVTSFVTGSELSLFLLKGVNSAIHNDPYHEICVYSLNKELAIVTPDCAIFPSIELATCDKIIVALDVPSWQSSLVAPSRYKYLYLYDIKMVEHVVPELINKINDSDYRVIARNKKHAEYLKKRGFRNIIDKCVPEFSIQALKDIINETI